MVAKKAPNTAHKTKGKRVLLGMSGGVDSSVAALLLLQQGYEVIGAFMKTWSGDVFGPASEDDPTRPECGWRQERRDALRVATELGIPFHTFDFEDIYRREVLENLFSEYAAGRTPNPDILCNREIKFKPFVEEMKKLGCDFVATGHYAQIVHTKDGAHLHRAVDHNKDQTYFLWAIQKDVLPHVLFPIGHLTKPEVRKIAEEHGLATAAKKESMGICFVGDVEISSFLKSRLPIEPGPIKTTEGKEVGRHDGLAFYTIGQRHGLCVGGGLPYYVIGKDEATNTLIVGSGVHPDLFAHGLTASSTNWFEQVHVGMKCLARVRHRQELFEAEITDIQGDACTLVFTHPVRAVTPGQSVVLYDDQTVLGGGIIERAIKTPSSVVA